MWNKDYKRGSTIFVAAKDNEVEGWRCVVCGDFFYNDLVRNTYESHEILHLLQTIRARQERPYHDRAIFEPAPEEMKGSQ